jgi:hypothetical protein
VSVKLVLPTPIADKPTSPQLCCTDALLVSAAALVIQPIVTHPSMYLKFAGQSQGVALPVAIIATL